MRTGLTIGEFARMAAAERRIPVSLTVVPVTGWTRGRWYDETGLPWANPSPNIRSLTQALLYSGIGLLEATNLSVGRGTDTPFEVVGAPWIDGEGVAAAFLVYLSLHTAEERRRRMEHEPVDAGFDVGEIADAAVGVCPAGRDKLVTTEELDEDVGGRCAARCVEDVCRDHEANLPAWTRWCRAISSSSACTRRPSRTTSPPPT